MSLLDLKKIQHLFGKTETLLLADKENNYSDFCILCSFDIYVEYSLCSRESIILKLW